MKTIKISDKETFDAVYGLIENCLPSSGGYFCENGKIRSGDTLFVFSEEGEDGGGEEAAKAFGRFDVLKARGAAVQNSAKLWDAFVANVLDDFYKDNAYLVYKPIESRADAAVQIEMVKKLVELLNPELFRENTKLEIKPDSKVNDLVYEVAVKLKMRLGGEPVSVINKFYIEDTSDGLRAVSGARCRMLYLQINEKIKSAAAVKEAAASDLAPITGGAASEIIKVISELLASEDGFQDYLTGEAEKAFYGYAEKQKEILESAEIEEITCSDAKLRYIAALTLLNKSYICSSFVGGKEKRLFRFAFSASNAITAVCLQCGETLISSNVFTVTAGDVTASVTLDTAKYAEGFGLD
ncbi:MAG TPA: hypothetical protein P5161_05145, partial [Eubacteriales bacterium]|nr:hypothetical protein [Eubacteriales bacterium]